MVTSRPLGPAVFVFACGAAGLAGQGCQIVGDIHERRLETEDALPPPECATNIECTKRATAEGPGVVPPDPNGGAYTGTLPDGRVPAACVQPRGECVRLLTPDCPTLTGELTNNAILLGTYLTVSGNLANSNIPRQRSAVLAAEEINSSVGGGGIPKASGEERRPLVVLECDPSNDPLRTARHLIEVGVPAVVGPNLAEDILSITQELRGKLLLMSPTAPPDPISSLLDEGLTWRTVPSDSQRAKLLLDQINEVEGLAREVTGKSRLKLAIPFRNDALGLSARDSISGHLLFNDHYISDPQNAQYVSLDPFDLTDTEAQAKLATKYATEFVPDIVLVLANEVVANIVVPFEKQRKALEPNGSGPYYIATDVAKVPTWLMGSMNPDVLPDFRTRVRGIGLWPDGNSVSVFNSFNAAYTSRYGTNPSTSAMGTSYDSMYAIAYALAATAAEPVTPRSVATGLRFLASGTPIQVGQNQANQALLTLSSGAPITLRGTHSLLKWDFNGDIVGGTMQVWCIGLAGGAPVFASAGKTLDVATQTIDGTYTQCE